jgi:hypothetical protein
MGLNLAFNFDCNLIEIENFDHIEPFLEKLRMNFHPYSPYLGLSQNIVHLKSILLGLETSCQLL